MKWLVFAVVAAGFVLPALLSAFFKSPWFDEVFRLGTQTLPWFLPLKVEDEGNVFDYGDVEGSWAAHPAKFDWYVERDDWFITNLGAGLI